MSDTHSTREALYERIKNSSKESVVLEEMQRAGFWPTNDKPTIQADLLKREQALVKELDDLAKSLHQVQDPVAALKLMRKERMAKAKERRELTKQAAAKARFERASQWHERRKTEVLYVGDSEASPSVSAGLNAAQGDAQRLAKNNLPILHTAAEIAGAMGIRIGELRFLTFTRNVSKVSHYARFSIAKKTGGERVIHAPHERLKRAQYWVLDNILLKPHVDDCAHGFVAGRSIMSNAKPHVGKAVVINLDLKDYFPSVHYPRVKAQFQEFGYSSQAATLLALLCTHCPQDEVSVDGERFFVSSKSERALPQGAPTSPALTNLIARTMDRRLKAMASKLGFVYTRYADDLTFSAPTEGLKNVAKLRWRVGKIIESEGLRLHPAKQHVMRSSQRQEVTGIVVNKQMSIARDTMRRFRAVLQQIEKHGPQGKHWNGNPDVISAMLGYARFITMVDANRGRPLVQKLIALQAKWPAKLLTEATVHTPITKGVRKSVFRKHAALGESPKPNWWQPKEVAAPVVEKTTQQVQVEKAQAKAEVKAQAINQAKTEQQTGGSNASAAGSASGPSANSASVSDSSSGHFTKTPLYIYGSVIVQFLIFLVAARILKDSLILVAGMFWFAFGMFTRRNYWWLFAVVLVAVISLFKLVLR